VYGHVRQGFFKLQDAPGILVDCRSYSLISKVNILYKRTYIPSVTNILAESIVYCPKRATRIKPSSGTSINIQDKTSIFL
jgi:hypothetical protein